MQQFRITPDERVAGGECFITRCDDALCRVYMEFRGEVRHTTPILADARGDFGPIFLEDGAYEVNVYGRDTEWHETITVPFVAMDLDRK
jgi:hypothetical protein